MKRIYILAFITFLTLTSCGKSEREIKIEKIHEQKVHVGKRKKLTELTMQLQSLPEALIKAQENIKVIKIFKIGRSKTTRRKQLIAAQEELTETRNFKEQLKNEISQLEYLKTFDFQKEPKNVLKYLFKFAKKGDFSNFRNLCDPYGENNRAVNSICYAEMLSKKRKKELQDMFRNGKIIGKPFIEKNTAEIEFAFGLNSNKIKKMSLIKRNNFWYLYAL
jgi:hypothetical protein